MSRPPNRRVIWTRSVATAICLVPLAATALAQTQNSYPMLMSLKPVAVQIGQTAEVELASRYSLLGASRVLVTGNGLTGESLPPEKPPEVKPGQPKPVVPKVKLKFTAAPDAVPGVRDFRVFTPQGVSTVGQLLLTRDVVVPETAENNTSDKAQMVPFPATLCGTVEKAEDVDWFKFRIDAPTTVVFQVWAQRLENRIHDLQVHVDPIITLRTAAGATLATADNVVAGDPLLIHRFEQPGEYLLDIRDVRYQGNGDWVYAIEMSPRPLLTQFFPAVVAPGVETSVAAVGWNMPADSATKITLPAETRPGILFASVRSPVNRSGPRRCWSARCPWSSRPPPTTTRARPPKPRRFRASCAARSMRRWMSTISYSTPRKGTRGRSRHWPADSVLPSIP